MNRLVFCALGGALLVSAALLSPSAPAITAGDSGISGVVRADDRCSQREVPCRSDVGQVTVVIRDSDSGKRVRTLHPRDARLRAVLAPGSYRLRATTSGGLAASARATVQAHHFTAIALRLHARHRA